MYNWVKKNIFWNLNFYENFQWHLYELLLFGTSMKSFVCSASWQFEKALYKWTMLCSVMLCLWVSIKRSLKFLQRHMCKITFNMITCDTNSGSRIWCRMMNGYLNYKLLNECPLAWHSCAKMLTTFSVNAYTRNPKGSV